MLNIITIPPVDDPAHTQAFVAALGSGAHIFSTDGAHKTARGKTKIFQALLKAPMKQANWRSSWTRRLLTQDSSNRLPRGFKPITFGLTVEEPVEIQIGAPVAIPQERPAL